MGYVTYEYYKSIYGEDSMPETDFNRLSWEACDWIDNLTLNKLEFAFPTKERDIEKVRRCVCIVITELYQVEQIKKSAMDAIGYTQQEDGSVRGKVVTSISSGSESIGFSAGGTSSNTAETKAAQSEKDLSEEVVGKVKRILYNAFDSNGVRLTYAGIPYPVRHAPISRPPENKPEEPTEPQEPEG